jgi:hypothetical protein
MSSTLSTGILVFFAFTAVLHLAISIVREKWLKQLNFRIPASLFRQIALYVLVVGALLGLRGFISEDALSTELLFAAGVLLPFILKRVGVQSGPLGVILLLLAVCQTKFLPQQLPNTNALAALLGLGVYKISENIIFGLENTFDDVLPALIWLTGSFWLTSANASAVAPLQENILLVCLTLSLWLKFLQTPFLSEDKVFIKRILLTAAGGLALLLIIMKVLLVPKMAPLAALYAAGLFFTYMFEPAGQSEEKQTFDPVRLLVLIGVLTVAATRLFGTYGLLVLAPATIVSTVPEGAALAGMFWISRTLLQAFIVLYNSNVTGVNLMHSYTSAALYGGVIVVFLLSLAIRDIKNTCLTTAVLLIACALLPPGMIYFLHEEPSSSLLIAATVAAITISSLVPVFYKRQETSAQKNLMVVPVLMATASLLAGQLVERGNQATSASRLQLVIAMAALTFVVYLAFYFYNLSKTRGQAIDVPREQS